MTSIMAQTFESFSYPGCTSSAEEPWWSRPHGDGKPHPPLFAAYTRVNLPTTVSFGEIVQDLSLLTEWTDSHYLWALKTSNEIEVWAHIDNIMEAKKKLNYYLKALHKSRLS